MSEQDRLSRIAKMKAGLLGVFGGIAVLVPDGAEAKSKADHQIRVPQAKEISLDKEKRATGDWNMNDLADLYQQINKRFFEDYSLCGYDNRGTLEAIVSNGKKTFSVGKDADGVLDFNGFYLNENGELYKTVMVANKNVKTRIRLSEKSKTGIANYLGTMDNLCTKEENRFKENPEEYLARRNPGNQQLLTMLMRNDNIREGKVDGLEIKVDRKTKQEYLSYETANPQKPRKSLEYKIKFGRGNVVEIEGVSGYEDIANILKEAVIKGEKSGEQKGRTLDITQMLDYQNNVGRP